MGVLVFLPFYLPDSIVYIEKREIPEYNPVWEVFAYIAMMALGFLAGKGLMSIFSENKLEKTCE